MDLPSPPSALSPSQCNCDHSHGRNLGPPGSIKFAKKSSNSSCTWFNKCRSNESEATLLAPALQREECCRLPSWPPAPGSERAGSSHSGSIGIDLKIRWITFLIFSVIESQFHWDCPKDGVDIKKHFPHFQCIIRNSPIAKGTSIY